MIDCQHLREVLKIPKRLQKLKEWEPPGLPRIDRPELVPLNGLYLPSSVIINSVIVVFHLS